MSETEIRKSRWMKRIKWILVTATVLIGVGCGGGGLTPEQLKELEETKSAALAAEEKIQQQKVTRKELNEDLTTKRAELKQLLADKAVLMERFWELEQLNKDEAETDTSSVENDDGR